MPSIRRYMSKRELIPKELAALYDEGEKLAVAFQK